MFVPVVGSNGADVLDDLNVGTAVFALGGDDMIYADDTDLSFVPQPWGGVLPQYAVDTIDGGTGNDMLSYIYATTGIDADLSANQVERIGVSGNFALDIVLSVENLIGSDFDDIIAGDDMSNYLHGRFGDDTMHGNGDDDLVVGGAGNDTLRGGQGVDTLQGGKDDDTLFGDQGNDTLEGGDGDDTLSGGTGDDILDGGAGDDRLEGGSGSDTLIGGVGSDTADFGTYGFDVDVYMYFGHADTVFGTTTLSGIENVTTGIGDDYVLGTSGANHIQTDKGHDTVFGLSGGDTIWTALGNDFVDAGAGDDSVSTAGGNDEVLGGAGEDTIIGAAGADVLRGGDNDDTIDAGVDNDWLFGGKGANELTLGLGFDVVGWEVGEVGLDRIKDFDLDQDHFSFEAGLLANHADLDDVLTAYTLGNEVYVKADLAGIGWRTIAILEGVGENDLNDAIADESILFQAQTQFDGPDVLIG